MITDFSTPFDFNDQTLSSAKHGMVSSSRLFPEHKMIPTKRVFESELFFF